MHKVKNIVGDDMVIIAPAERFTNTYHDAFGKIFINF